LVFVEWPEEEGGKTLGPKINIYCARKGFLVLTYFPRSKRWANDWAEGKCGPENIADVAAEERDSIVV
jgi:hypothetical protein